MIYCRGCLDPGRLCVWWALSACSITHMPRCQWASPVAILWGPSHGQAPRVIHGLKGKLTVKVCVRVCVCVCVLLSHVRTFVTPWTASPPGSSVHGILQARILEWLPFPSPRELPTPGSNPGLLHCRRIHYRQSHQGNPLTVNREEERRGE